MERDKKLEKIIREYSLLSPSDSFTESVLEKIKVAPSKDSYKPLIRRRTGYIVFSLLAIILLIAIFSSTNGMSEPYIIIPDLDLTFSEWNLTFPEIDWKFPSGMLAGVIAVFVLILADARVSRNRSSQ